MWIDSIPKHYGARCVFKSICDHALATHIAHHEFANYPSKPVCDEHTKRLRKVIRG